MSASATRRSIDPRCADDPNLFGRRTTAVSIRGARDVARPAPKGSAGPADSASLPELASEHAMERLDREIRACKRMARQRLLKLHMSLGGHGGEDGQFETFARWARDRKKMLHKNGATIRHK